MAKTEDVMERGVLSEKGVGSGGAAPVVNEVSGPSTAVDGDTAERFIAEKHIGERIKHLRLKKAMGLVELGRHTGLSASFLSQLETGRVVPTLRNLARIAMVFSKDLSYFFLPEPQKLFRMNRSRDRVRLAQTGTEDPSYFFESLGVQVADRQLQPYFADFLPAKAGREPRAHQHAGFEFLYLISGQLDVRHGDAVHHVESGDGVYFDASISHSYISSSAESATAIIVLLQQPTAAGMAASGRTITPGINTVRGMNAGGGMSGEKAARPAPRSA